MPLVIEIAVLGTFQGKPHNNIYHVIEDTGIVLLDDAIDVFENTFLPALSAVQVDSLTYNQITARPLDILDNRTPIVRPISISGGSVGNEFLPAGNHLWTVFETAGIGLKAGGKMVSGWPETLFSGGEPAISLLDTVEVAFELLNVTLNFASFFLSVYRPAFSLPGVPTASLVTSIRTRGDSTNNRRMNPFIR